MAVTFYIIRHGQTEANARPIFSGDIETPLTELGHKQAQEIADHIINEFTEPPYIILSSPLSRARDTIAYVRNAIEDKFLMNYEDVDCIASGIQKNLANFATIEDRIRDRNMGSIRWKRFDDPELALSEEARNDLLHNVRSPYPGMETFDALTLRSESAIDEILDAVKKSHAKNAIIVIGCHKETSRFLHRALLGCSELPDMFMKNCACLRLVLDDNNNVIEETDMRETWNI